MLQSLSIDSKCAGKNIGYIFYLYRKQLNMKLVLSIILAFLLHWAIGLKITEPAIYNNILKKSFKGHVKSCTEYHTDSINGPNGKPEKWKSTTCFDKHGLNAHLRLYNSNGISVMSLDFVYNFSGREVSCSEGGRIISRSYFSYNSKNLLVEKVSEGTRVSSLRFYNKNGEINSMLDLDRYGKPILKVKYSYDKKNKKSEEQWLNDDSSLNYRVQRKYDKNHNLVYESCYDADGIKQSYTSYSYDFKGNEIAKTDSNVIYIRGTNGILKSDTTSKKAINTNLLALVQPDFGTSSINKVFTTTYKYLAFDEKGNWLQQEELVNDKVIKTIKRSFEYY